MTTLIERVPRAKVSELISGLDPAMMSNDDVQVLCKWMRASSVVWSGVVDDRLLCLWGLVPPTILSDQAYLWLQTTEAVECHEFLLVRRSQIELRRMLKLYPRIVGHCEVIETRSIRWLRWLGAVFGEPQGRLIPFSIRKEA